MSPGFQPAGQTCGNTWQMAEHGREREDGGCQRQNATITAEICSKPKLIINRVLPRCTSAVSLLQLLSLYWGVTHACDGSTCHPHQVGVICMQTHKAFMFAVWPASSSPRRGCSARTGWPTAHNTQQHVQEGGTAERGAAVRQATKQVRLSTNSLSMNGVNPLPSCPM